MLNGIVQLQYLRFSDVVLIFVWLANLGTEWLTVEPDVSDHNGKVYLGSQLSPLQYVIEDYVCLRIVLFKYYSHSV